MYYYLSKKKISGKWTAIRTDGKILVFTKDDSAKNHFSDFNKISYKLKPMKFHPSSKRSSIYGKKYTIME